MNARKIAKLAFGQMSPAVQKLPLDEGSIQLFSNADFDASELKKGHPVFNESRGRWVLTLDSRVEVIPGYIAELRMAEVGKSPFSI